MKLGRIVGTVVATRKDPKIEGLKLYLVQDVGLSLEGKASFVVAADAMGAGWARWSCTRPDRRRVRPS